MFVNRYSLIMASVCCLSLAGLGCNQGPVYEMNKEVRGTLTLDGKPLVNVNVQFVPEPKASQPNLQCPLSMGVTDEKGNFALACDNGKPGAVIGRQRVVVPQGREQGSDQDDAASAPATGKPGQIPAVYTVAATSPCFVEVTGGQHEYKISLSSK
jgi:hypothetical protein